MRSTLPTVKKEKTIERETWMLTQLSICFYGGLHPPMKSSLKKIYVFRRKETTKGDLYLFLGFQGFISKEPLKGPEEVEIWWGKVWGIWGMRQDPGAKGFEGFLGHLRCVGCEGGTVGIATSSFRKVGATFPSRWSIGGSNGPHWQFCRMYIKC